MPKNTEKSRKVGKTTENFEEVAESTDKYEVFGEGTVACKEVDLNISG